MADPAREARLKGGDGLKGRKGYSSKGVATKTAPHKGAHVMGGKIKGAPNPSNVKEKHTR